MGIFIGLNISKAVTKEEWEKVYEETLSLVKKLPLAELVDIDVCGTRIRCLVPIEERERPLGYEGKGELGWTVNGDYLYMRIAEKFYLPRDIVNNNKVEPNAGDAMMGNLPAWLSYSWNEENCSHVYSKWGNKTQGEPYHIYLLAIAALIESRLGSKAFTDGDITRGQFRKAVAIANEYLEKPIDLPDRCYMDRLLKRVKKLPISENEQFEVFEKAYLGTKDAEFGEYIRCSFSPSVIHDYWKNRFENRYNSSLYDYLLWGFEFGELCDYIAFEDTEDISQYEKFIKEVMDKKLHLKDKDCSDVLQINQEDEEPSCVGFQFAQFLFGNMRNTKINRYIPIEDIRSVLVDWIGDKCAVNEIIDSYLFEEAHLQTELSDSEKEDAAMKFQQTIKKMQETLNEDFEKYDVSNYANLRFYEAGDSIEPGMVKQIGKYTKFLDSILEEESFRKLMEEDAHIKCEWIAKINRSIPLRDTDWEKIFTDIEDNPESFSRYYPVFRVKLDESVRDFCTAFLINDDVYYLAKELAQ